MNRLAPLLLAALLASSTLLAFAPPAAATAYDGWGAPTTLQTGGWASGLDKDSVSYSAQGYAIAAWTYYEPDFGSYIVRSSIYVPQVGWGAPYTYFGTSFTTSMPATAALSDGSLLLAYHDPGDYVTIQPFVWAQIWSPEVGWMAGANISTANTTDFISLTAGADGNGNAFVAWIDYEGAYTNVTVRKYNWDTGWDAEAVTLDNRADLVTNLRLSVSPGGDALAAWTQFNGGDLNVYASRYSPSGGWSGPEQVDQSALSMSGSQLQAAISSSGTPVITFSQTNGTTFNLWGSTYAQGSWSTPVRVNPGSTYLALNNVALQPLSDGSFVAVWAEASSGWNNINSSRLSGGAWSSPEPFIPGEPSSIPAIVTAPDSKGGLTVAYADWVGASRQIKVGTWTVSGLSVTGSLDGGTSLDETVSKAASANGHAALLFLQANGMANDERVVLFDEPDRTPPEIYAYLLEGPVTHNATVLVQGAGAIEAGLTVNGVAAYYVGFGIWEARVPLHAGNNTLTVIARDAAGNLNSTRLYIWYDDPVPGLEANLTQAQADAAASAAQAAAAQANATAAQNQLTAANQQIASLQARVAAAEGNASTQSSQAASMQSKVDGANAAAGTAMVVGLLGLLVGVAAIAMGFMMGKKGRGAGPTSVASPPPAASTAQGPPK